MIKRKHTGSCLSSFFSLRMKKRLAAIRQDFSLDSQEPIDVITEEFNKLFFYPQGRLVPLESLFTPAGGVGYTDIASVYASTDLAIDDAYDVAPDHISVEFLFMSYLIETGKTEVEQKFLEQHLMNWVPYYCEDVMKQAQTLFYRATKEVGFPLVCSRAVADALGGPERNGLHALGARPIKGHTPVEIYGWRPGNDT